MIYYIITFILSLFLIKLSQLFKKNKFLSKFFLILGLIVPCILAGLRDETIGTDVLIYQKPHFILAKNYSSFFEYMIKLDSSEYLYYLLTWITSNVFNSLGLLFFMIELLVILPLYRGLEKIKNNDNDVIIGMALFYMLWYDQTYNMARQSIAISFSILSLINFENKNYYKSYLLLIIAFLFHNSAMFMIPVFLIMQILRGNGKKVNKMLLVILIIVFVSLVMINFTRILKLLSLSFLTNNGFGKYVNYVNVLGGSELMWKQLVMWIVFLGVTILFSFNIKKYTNNYYFYLLIICISLFGFYASTIVSFTNRIFYYLSYSFVYIVLSRLPYSCKKKTNRLFLIVILLGFSSLFWVSSSVIGNGNHTMPYKFAERG